MPLPWLLGRSVVGPAAASRSQPYAALPRRSVQLARHRQHAAHRRSRHAGLPRHRLSGRLRARPGARAASQVVLLAAIILPLSVGVGREGLRLADRAAARRRRLAAHDGDSASGTSRSACSSPRPGSSSGAANVFLPFMILPIYSVVKLIDPRLSRGGATLGASPLYRFARVTLPLTLPGIVTGIAFVFSLSVSMYVIPSAADRRPLPDAGDADRPLVPVHAQRAARLDHRRRPPGPRGRRRRRLDLARHAARGQRHDRPTERIARRVVIWVIGGRRRRLPADAARRHGRWSRSAPRPSSRCRRPTGRCAGTSACRDARLWPVGRWSRCRSRPSRPRSRSSLGTLCAIALVRGTVSGPRRDRDLPGLAADAARAS